MEKYGAVAKFWKGKDLPVGGGISFTHLVEAQTAKANDREKCIDKARKKKWSAKRLRNEINKMKEKTIISIQNVIQQMTTIKPSTNDQDILNSILHLYR